MYIILYIKFRSIVDAGRLTNIYKLLLKFLNRVSQEGSIEYLSQMSLLLLSRRKGDEISLSSIPTALVPFALSHAGPTFFLMFINHPSFKALH